MHESFTAADRLKCFSDRPFNSMLPPNINHYTMKSWFALVAILIVSVGLLARTATPTPSSRMLSHDVYFSLNDNSEAAKQRLVQACQKYLADHPGTVWFDAAVLATEYRREVNDVEFDVALHLVFKDKAAHDRYQEAPRHQQFIEENRDNWKKVRVFDSWILVSAHPGLKTP
jgi:hypothetical protein